MEAFVKKYTKLFLATLCFISSAPVLADGYKGEAPPLPCVTIPNFNGGFEFTIGPVWMQPTSSNLTYVGVNQSATLTGATTSITTSIWSDSSISPNYDWGFMFGVGYVFPNTANDVKVDWLYFHNDYSNSTGVLGVSGVTTEVVNFPLETTGLLSGQAFDVSGKVDYDFDAVDLTFGQYVNIGPRLQTRMFAGLRYMRLNDDLTINSVEVDPRTTPTGSTVTEFSTGQLNSSFNGLGPLFGIKADYYIGSGFSISGGFDAALLVGELSFSGNQLDTITAITSGGVSTVTAIVLDDLNWDSQNTVSPAFDGKFGLNYKYQFNNGTLLALELGYQVTKYIDVVEELDRGALFSPTSFDTDVTNFGLNGPYLTLNVKI